MIDHQRSGCAPPLESCVARHARSVLAALSIAAAVGARAQNDDVPFVTTPDSVTLAMLQLAEVGARDHVVDLGSGDGRIVITAARRFGATGLGVEIVPDLVQKSRENARAAGVQDRVEFRQQDLFETDLRRATVVTLYLLPDVNLQLRPRLLALAPGTRIVSHDWDMGDWQPEKTLTLDVPDKLLGKDKFSRVHLWVVPAPVQGLWCAADGASLHVTQRFQSFSATLQRRGSAAPALVFDGRIQGAHIESTGLHRVVLQWQDGGLHVIEPAGVPTIVETRFAPAQGAACPA